MKWRIGSMVIVLCILGSMLQAGIVATTSNPSDFWALTSSPNSLILEGSSTLLSKSSTDPATAYGFGGYEQLNNGTFSPLASGQALTEGTYQITYILDTSVNTLGYDLASLRSILYYGDAGRRNHVYEVWIGYVGGAVGTDVFLGNVYWDTSSTLNATTVVDATFDAAILTTGVDVIQFSIGKVVYGNAYTALEVVGTATLSPQGTLVIIQ